MIPKIIYEVDYEKFGKQLVPRLIRQSKLLAWVKALIAPVVSRYDAFYRFKERQIYITGHNAQITLFEQALNDSFDIEERRIYIENAVISDTDHYYDPEFGDADYCIDGEPDYYYDKSKYNQTGGNFSVNVPKELEEADPTDKLLFETALKAEIERYKIFGTTYTIKYYA